MWGNLVIEAVTRVQDLKYNYDIHSIVCCGLLHLSPVSVKFPLVNITRRVYEKNRKYLPRGSTINCVFERVPNRPSPQLDTWHVNALLEPTKYSRPFELVLARARKRRASKGTLVLFKTSCVFWYPIASRERQGPLTLELHGEAIDFPSSLLVLVDSTTQWSSEPCSYGTTVIYPKSLDICAISFATATLNLPVSSRCSKKWPFCVLLRPCSSFRSGFEWVWSENPDRTTASTPVGFDIDANVWFSF